jgi:hypothetical protein
MEDREYKIRFNDNGNMTTPTRIDKVINIQAMSANEMFSELLRDHPDAYILTITKMKKALKN